MVNGKQISLHVFKAELKLFTSSKKQLDCDLKKKLNGKRLYEKNSVRYFGIQIDRRLTWKDQINHVAPKLKKVNAILSKLAHVLDLKSLRSVYYAVFECNLFEHKTLI